LGIEVEWRSATEIALDIATVAPYLWPESPRVPLQVRLTDFDPASNGQTPLTPWSTAYVFISDDAAACDTPPFIVATTPEPPACVLRDATAATARTIVLQGIGFPAPRTSQNIQFRRSDTGAESLHLGIEVEWRSATEIALDIATVAPYLWPESPRVPLQVRLTDFDPASNGQTPLTSWSNVQIVIADNAIVCAP
jgi:hypothetical protein